MQYSKTQGGESKNGVAVGFSVDFPVNPDSGKYWHHLQACFAHSLSGSGGKYTTAIGDLEMRIEEVSSPSSTITEFDIKDKNSVKPHGSQPLQSLIPGWAKNLTQETAKFAVSNIDPIFGVFLSAAFRTAAGSSNDNGGRGSIRIRDTPWYVPKPKIRNKPLAQTFDFGTALVLGGNTSLSGTAGSQSISGTAKYEISIEGDTYNTSQSLGPAGIGNKTGTIFANESFTISWQ